MSFDRNNKSDGFTITEMLIVMMIVAILFGITLPVLGEFVQRSRLDKSAATVAIALRAARTEAITRNRIVHFRYYATANRMYVLADGNSDFSLSQLEWNDTDVKRLAEYPLEEGTYISSGDYWCYFLPDGSVSSNVELPLYFTDDDLADSETVGRAVKVRRLSGAMSVAAVRPGGG